MDGLAYPQDNVKDKNSDICHFVQRVAVGSRAPAASTPLAFSRVDISAPLH